MFSIDTYNHLHPIRVLPITIDHAFALSSKVCILNFQLEEFVPSSFLDSWRYDSKLLFIFAQLNTPIGHHWESSICYTNRSGTSLCHHRASLICCHRTDQGLHCATTGQNRSATTEQINKQAPTRHHRAKVICFHRTDRGAALHHHQAKTDLLPPSRSQSSISPPPGRFRSATTERITEPQFTTTGQVRSATTERIKKPQFATTEQIKSTATEQKSPCATTRQE